MNHGEAGTRVKSTLARFWFPFLVLVIPLLESLLIFRAFLPYRVLNIYIISMTSLHRDFGTSTGYVGLATMVGIAFRLLSVPFVIMLIIMLFQHNRRFHRIMLWYVWLLIMVCLTVALVRFVTLSDYLSGLSELPAMFAALAFTIYSRRSSEYARVFKHYELDVLMGRLNESR